MVTVTVPTNKGVYPSRQDHCICFNTDEFRLTSAAEATLSVSFSPGVTNPNGEILKVFGKEFITDDSTSFTQDTLDTSVDTQQAAENFMNMLQLNVFSKDMDISLLDQGPLGWSVVITAKKKGNNDTYLDFDFSGLSNPYVVTSFSSGSDASFLPGYEIQWQLFDINDNEICGVQFIQPCYNEDTDTVIQPPCLNFENLISSVLFSPLPDCDKINPTFIDVQHNTFKLCFWSAYDSGSGKVFNQLNTSSEWKVINAALEYNEDFSEFYYTGGTYRFLTNKPEKAYCQSQCDFLYVWLETSQHDIFPISIGEETSWALNINGIRTLVDYQTGVLCIPINLSVGVYDIKIEAVAVDTNFGNIVTNQVDVTETFNITVKDEGCNEKIFFLNSKGTYDSVDCFKIITESIVTSGFQICKEVECGSEDKGFTQITDESYEQITLSTRAFKFSNDMLKWLKEFKASETKLILWNDKQGREILRRFIVDYGTFIVWQNDGAITVTMKGRFSNNLKVVSE